MFKWGLIFVFKNLQGYINFVSQFFVFSFIFVLIFFYSSFIFRVYFSRPIASLLDAHLHRLLTDMPVIKCIWRRNFNKFASTSTTAEKVFRWCWSQCQCLWPQEQIQKPAPRTQNSESRISQRTGLHTQSDINY